MDASRSRSGYARGSVWLPPRRACARSPTPDPCALPGRIPWTAGRPFCRAPGYSSGRNCLGAAGEIFVERLIRVVEPIPGQVQRDGVVAAHDPGQPLRGVDRVELTVDIDLLQLVDQDDRRIAIGRNVAR